MYCFLSLRHDAIGIPVDDVPFRISSGVKLVVGGSCRRYHGESADSIPMLDEWQNTIALVKHDTIERTLDDNASAYPSMLERFPPRSFVRVK